MAALLYDSFLVAAIWMVLGFLLQLIVGPDSNQLVDGVVKTDPLLDVILFLIMIASSSGFYIWFWTQSGQTLGMIAWRIKVETLDENLISFQQGVSNQSRTASQILSATLLSNSPQTAQALTSHIYKRREWKTT